MAHQPWNLKILRKVKISIAINQYYDFIQYQGYLVCQSPPGLPTWTRGCAWWPSSSSKIIWLASLGIFFVWNGLIKSKKLYFGPLRMNYKPPSTYGRTVGGLDSLGSSDHGMIARLPEGRQRAAAGCELIKLWKSFCPFHTYMRPCIDANASQF